MKAFNINDPVELIHAYDYQAQGLWETKSTSWKTPLCLDHLEEHIEELIAELPEEQRAIFEI